ncbi:MAG: RNA polymerase sporulation sigma factor SigH [Actinomycetota bacterium]|nr:RNA polymerase sporulation sigma factor SigH [Actinomycetota bacterium]
MALLYSLPLLHDLDDEELVARFQRGDRDALEVLIGRYRRFARSKARTYFVVGADDDDVEQEGMIGLFKAARDYRFDRQAPFRAFAEVCVTRQVITAIKAATRHKHQLLNRSVSISAVASEQGETTLEGLLDDHHGCDPADEVVRADQAGTLRRSMDEVLSGLEVDVLRLYVDGKSYQEIAVDLGRHAKSVDNALQRIKRKLGFQLEGDESATPALVA